MPRARDPFLDGLRSVSVVRVILLHLLQRVELPFLATFSFFMPGMPLLFFVSGALTAVSLGKTGADARRRFWKERARRLLVPFWAFGIAILAACAVTAAIVPDAQHAFPWSSLWRWVVPLAGPQASPAFDKLDWHMWFMSSLLMMLACAPWTLALHRRWAFSGAAVFFAAGAALEVAAVPVPDVVRNTLLFGAAFQLGYGYADGRLRRMSRFVLGSIAAVLGASAFAFYFARAPGAMLHAVPLALVVLGLAFVALWMLVRPLSTRLFEHPRATGAIKAINARAFTIYLWGPVSNDLAFHLLEPATAAGYAGYFTVSLLLLAGFVRLFGPVEDWAARRVRISGLEVPPATALTPETRAA